jgi:hypothetical protein
MFKSFAVKNFRCLNDFEVHGLARVNIFVGDNDTGKTALLEALFAHLLQTNVMNLIALKAIRRTLGTAPDESFWQEFFTGLDDAKEILLTSVDSEGKSRKSRLTARVATQVSLGSPAASGDAVPPLMRPPVLPSASSRVLRAEYFDDRSDTARVNEVTLDPLKASFAQTNPTSPDVRAYLFPVGGPSELETLAKHVSEILVRKQESLLVSIAKIVDERVQGLSVVSLKGTSELYVDLGEPRLVPLNLFGSGVVRAIGIAAAIPNYANGALLVDEIETGIYYKRLPDFLKTVHQMAKASGVQVFATTHSAECIAAAIEAVAPDLAESDPLHVYKLVRGRSMPIPYEKESLESVSEFMADVR